MEKVLIGVNIKRLREQRGLSVNELARRSRVNRGNMSKIENGHIGASVETLARIAGSLKVPLAAVTQESSNVSEPKENIRSVPLLAWHQISPWIQGKRSFPGDGPMQTAELLKASSVETFALHVEGDSMEPTFKAGDTIHIDPKRKPRPGSFVVASSAGEYVFRQYRDLGPDEKGGRQFELIPLNQLYPTLRSDRDIVEIAGTVISFLRPLEK